MLKRDGVYYLMYSGTGADSPNYAIGYATADSPRGPFKKYSGNPIVQRSEGIYGPGHHCVVTGPDGKLWMVYHQKRNDRTNFRRRNPRTRQPRNRATGPETRSGQSDQLAGELARRRILTTRYLNNGRCSSGADKPRCS